VLYSYCCLYSSRRIAKACRERVDFMSIVGLDAPDFRTISDFRKGHLKALGDLFKQVLHLCEKADDPHVIGAVLHAPGFLSGLSEPQVNMIRERAKTTLHPDLVAVQTDLNSTMAQLQEGMAATRRLLLSRCGLRANDDGQYRLTTSRSRRRPFRSNRQRPPRNLHGRPFSR
jgi:transposase-like protein DUF772